MRTSVRGVAIIVGVALAMAAGVIWALPLQSSSETSLISSPVTLNSVPELIQESSVIVIGTMTGDLGTRREATADADTFSIRRDIEFSVERYLKGSGDDSLVFNVAVGLHTERRGEMLYPDRQDAQLEEGSRYVLFLKSYPPSGNLAPTAEPWRFQLVDGEVVLISEVQFNPNQFSTSEAALIENILASR